MNEQMHDELAEMSTIGAMMIDSRVIPEVIRVVKAIDFHNPAHEAICEVIYDLSNHGEKVDVITVGSSLRSEGKMRGNLNDAYLWHLTTATPTAVNAAYYAEVVRTFSQRRQVALAGLQIQQLAEADETKGDIVELAREMVEDLGSSISKPPHRVSATVDAFIESLDKPVPYIQSPWLDLNALINGFREGSMAILAGRPGSGKSLLALNIARYVSQFGKVGYVSLEMGEDELQGRLLSQMATLSSSGISNRSLNADGKQRIVRARADMERLELYINDNSNTWADFAAYARELYRMGNLKMMVLDYVGLLDSGGNEESRQAEIARYSRQLKKLAKSLNIPILVLAQLKRDADGKEPVMSDLRDSGSLEQDADLIMLLHQKTKKNTQTNTIVELGEVKVIVPKHRQGKRGQVTLKFEGQYSRAVDLPAAGLSSFFDEN